MLLWRIFFILMCLQILIDGFCIYFFFPSTLMHFIKDIALIMTLFFFMMKEPLKDWMSALGKSLGSGIVLSMGTLFAIGVLQVFNPLSPGLLRGVLGIKLMYMPWVGILLGYAYADGPEQIEKVFKAIAIASIPINLFGVVQYMSDPNYMIMTFGPGFLANSSMANIYGVSSADSFVRIIGTFASSAHYALFLSMNTMICFALYFTGRRSKYFWLAVLLLNLFALLQTGSRGGFLVSLLMVAIFATLSRQGRPMITVLFITVVGMMIAFSTLKASVATRFKTVTEVKNLSERTVGTAPKQFTKYLNEFPMGKGIGSAAQAARHLGKREGKFYLVENYISKMQLELGIVGVIVFYLMIFLLMSRWFFTWLPPPSTNNLYFFAIAITAYCAGQFTVGTLFSSIETPPASVFLWVFTGFMARIATYDFRDNSYSHY